MLDVRAVRKTYGSIVAVDDVSLAVEPGEIIGLLGPNGAGKTTTVSMIAGLVTPTAGQVLVDGAPFASDTDPRKRRVGLVPQDLALYDELSALANLQFFGALYDLAPRALDRAIGEALRLVGLTDRARDRVGTFSGGMKRRLNLAAGLLHDPDILLLDEPTVGVDPQSRNAIFDNLTTLKERGKALLYTTAAPSRAASSRARAATRMSPCRRLRQTRPVPASGRDRLRWRSSSRRGSATRRAARSSPAA